MPVIREAAVAGRFYPRDATTLRADVQSFISEAEDAQLRPKALIVPHAGYVYSGSVAGSGYRQLCAMTEQIKRVVLIGPAHHVACKGIATSTADAFETPLGRVRVDSDAVAELLKIPCVHSFDAAHEPEHSLEVHLPFLQNLFDDFTIVPLVIGSATIAEAAEVIEHLWDGAETLVVVSTDLSHFHDFTTARKLDAETSRAIEELRYESLSGDRACGFLAVGGLLKVVEKRGLRVRVLDVRNSGDTAGSKDRVVGYGAYAIV